MKRGWIVLLAFLLAIALLISLSAWFDLFWFAPQTSFSKESPGAATEDVKDYTLDQMTADQIETKMWQLLADDQKLVAWYRLPGQTENPPAEKSTVALAMDQLRYGQYLLEQRNQKRFKSWWTDFRSDWLDSSGICYGSLSRSDQAGWTGSLSDDRLRANLHAARVLLLSCALWPDDARLSDLSRLSDLILQDLAGKTPTDDVAVVPKAKPIFDPGATPTPKPTVTPTPSPDESVKLSVLRLASIDLFAMKSLIQLDSSWQAVYDQNLQRVEEGFLGDDLPLFSYAYQPETDGYVPFDGSLPFIDTEEAILTILHLCEVGRVPQKSISWIRNQMYNEGAIYQSYHAGQGTAPEPVECLPAYAMIARIARIIKDEDLYRATTNRLLWHQATSQKSVALHAIFRTESDGSLFVYAKDNTWALLSIG